MPSEIKKLSFNNNLKILKVIQMQNWLPPNNCLGNSFSCFLIISTAGLFPSLNLTFVRTFFRCSCLVSYVSFVYFSLSGLWSFNLTKPLRYYATFKVRKLESLFYKTNAILQKTATSTRLHAEQMFCVNL